MANNRIYHAIEQLGILNDADTSSAYTAVHGLQSADLETNFNLESILVMGQLSVYDQIEELPDVTLTCNKVLDGYPLIYCLATRQATAPHLAARAVPKCLAALSIFDESNSSASGTPVSQVVCSGLFVNSETITIPVDGSATEDTTLVGNYKVWLNDSRNLNYSSDSAAPNFIFTGAFTNNNDAPAAVGGVARRDNVIFSNTITTTDSNGAVRDPDTTILPPEVFGISSSGTNPLLADNSFTARIQNISVSCDFGRESLNHLGRRGPYARNVTFPVDVTTEIEVISSSGDMISVTERGIYSTGGVCEKSTNQRDRTIRIALCEGTRIYTGKKNRLQSVSYNGGGADGSNRSVSYSFRTQNDFVVMHSGEQAFGATPSGWWAARATHLAPA